jgi:hypothetical protein
MRALLRRRQSLEALPFADAMSLGACAYLAEHHLQTDRALAQTLVDFGTTARNLRISVGSAAMTALHGQGADAAAELKGQLPLGLTLEVLGTVVYAR